MEPPHDLEVRESEIEDVFAHYPQLLKQSLKVSGDLYLLARQKPLRSGRLDLVYGCGSDLFLVELKVEDFKRKFLDQVLGYQKDLTELQRRGQFLRGDVVPYLLCPRGSESAVEYSTSRGVNLCVYDPREILLQFYRSAPLDTKYLSVSPTDKGVWRIGLTISSLTIAHSISDTTLIARAKGCSLKTLGNQMRLAEELGMVQLLPKSVALLPLGKDFLARRDSDTSSDFLSVAQADLLRTFILSNPFFSGVTFGIITMVACVFELSKNTYPVPRSLLARHFISAAGLHFRWSRDKATNKGVRMYSNYAIELGLLGKVGDSYFVTPSGLKFVLLLNMHKSLHFIETIEAIK